MRGHPSAPDLLSLHGVRVLGYTTPRRVGELYGLDPAEVEEHLLDAEARGWVRQTSFGGDHGWSLTDAGRAENERSLAEELWTSGVRDAVARVHREFVPLNGRVGPLLTRWQVRVTRTDPMAPNDHRDARYDDDVVRGLARLADDLRPLTGSLTECLLRFGVHQPRLEHALAQVQALRNAWVDAPDVPSFHIVWIQVHEDLLATLGLPRGQDDV